MTQPVVLAVRRRHRNARHPRRRISRNRGKRIGNMLLGEMRHFGNRIAAG